MLTWFESSDFGGVFSIFPDRRRCFLDRLTLPIRRAKTGPACVLVHAFQTAGWTFHAEGLLQHVSGLQLSWVTCSQRHLKQVIQLAWSHYVCCGVGHRKHFSLQYFDAKSLGKVVTNLPVVQQGFATSYTIGRHVARDVLSKYSKKVTNAYCLLCGELDGKEHRLFQCPGLSDLRPAYRKDLRWLQSQPLATLLDLTLPLFYVSTSCRGTSNMFCLWTTTSHMWSTQTGLPFSITMFI